MSNIKIIICLILVAILFIGFQLFDKKTRKGKLEKKGEFGSARFATEKEIKTDFKKEGIKSIKEAGFPIWFDKNRQNIWFDRQTPHWILIGSTGSGKSFTSVIPQCTFLANAKVKRSVFITDPKREIFDATSKMFKDNGYNIITLDFRNPEYSSHFNLLSPLIKEWDKYLEAKKQLKTIEEKLQDEESINNGYEEFKTNQEQTITLDEYKKKLEEDRITYQNKMLSHQAETSTMITSISTMIMSDKNAKDPFWNNSAKNLLEGLIGFFLEEYEKGVIPKEKITMTSIRKFQNSSMNKQNFKYLQNYIEEKPYGSKSKDSLTSIFSASENTYKSVTAVFGERMALFDDINVANVTSSSDFDADILGKEPTAFYIIVKDEDKSYNQLVTIMVGLLYKELTKLALTTEKKCLPVSIEWLLDEFANCPPLPDIDNIVSVARSRGMRFQFFIQSFSQLDNVYGKEVAQIILDNCGLCYLKTNTQSTAETISKRLGKATIESHSVSNSIGRNSYNGNESSSLTGRELMTPDEIMRLKYKTIIFSIVGFPIFRETVGYPDLTCYKDGFVPRELRALVDLAPTYFTVEDLKKQDEGEDEDEEMEESSERFSRMRQFRDNYTPQARNQMNETDDFHKNYIRKALNIIKEQLPNFEIKEEWRYNTELDPPIVYLHIEISPSIQFEQQAKISNVMNNENYHLEIDLGQEGKSFIDVYINSVIGFANNGDDINE